MLFDNVFVLDIDEKRSSLIRKIEYDEDNLLLTVYFKKYYTDKITYECVYPNHFKEFAKQKSIGKYFLNFIKPNFKQKYSFMSEEKKRPPTKNKASDQKRFIKISLDVRKIHKEWIMAGEKGDYLGITLHMLPDGQLDKFGNLGMVTQDVPTEVYKAAEAKLKGSGKEIKGPILGNGAEFDWNNSGGGEGQPGSSTGQFIDTSIADDLPF
jgi:hypothetical protein